MLTKIKIYRAKIHHSELWRPKDELGFVPMIIALVVIIAAIIWFVFIRVNSANG